MESNDVVSWCFSSLDKDIDFQVLFITADGFIQTIVPLCHVQSKESLITGEWKCVSSGRIRLVFDNSKSSWYSCSVSYEVTIMKNGQIAEEAEATEVTEEPIA